MNSDVKQPAIEAAEAGFDVWLGNSRGNIYSSNHQNYNDPFDKEHKKAFWDFSWADIGRYDLPVVIEFVKNMTKQEKMAYVGYS